MNFMQSGLYVGPVYTHITIHVSGLELPVYDNVKTVVNLSLYF